MLICTCIESDNYYILDTDDYTIQCINKHEFDNLLGRDLIDNIESSGQPKWVLSLLTGELCDIYVRNNWLVIQYNISTLTVSRSDIQIWYKNKLVTTLKLGDGIAIKDVILSPFSDKVIELVTTDLGAGRYRLMQGLTDFSRFFGEYESGVVRALEYPFSDITGKNASHILCATYLNNGWYGSAHLPIEIYENKTPDEPEYILRYNNKTRKYSYRQDIDMNMLNIASPVLVNSYKNMLTKYKRLFNKCSDIHSSYLIDYLLMKERSEFAFKVGLLDVYSHIRVDRERNLVKLKLDTIAIEDDRRSFVVTRYETSLV